MMGKESTEALGFPGQGEVSLKYVEYDDCTILYWLVVRNIFSIYWEQ